MCRKDIYGNGTYDRAISAIMDHHKKYNTVLTTKMTLSPENISFSSAAIIDLIKKGFTEIFVNCIYEEGWTYSHGTILYNEFKKIADYVIERDSEEHYPAEPPAAADIKVSGYDIHSGA